jgi:MFS family permease
MHGAEVDVGAFFVARMLPRSLFGTGMGGVSALGMLATAVGVVGFGQLYDRSGSYDSAIVGSAVLFFLSAVLYVMLIRSIRRGHHAQVA